MHSVNMKAIICSHSLIPLWLSFCRFSARMCNAVGLRIRYKERFGHSFATCYVFWQTLLGSTSLEVLAKVEMIYGDRLVDDPTEGSGLSSRTKIRFLFNNSPVYWSSSDSDVFDCLRLHQRMRPSLRVVVY